MSFGEQLQALRRSNNLTQEEFAQQLKVSRQAVSKWESSRGYPEIEKIIYICNTYGVAMSDLFQDEVPLAQQTQGTSQKATSANRPMEHQKLKKALGNFFTNLSPQNQQLFFCGIALILIILLVLCTTIISKGESNQMAMKLIWAGLLIAFAIGEGVTVGLTSIWFAAGSLAALICALLGGPLWLQIALFIVISALCLLAIRPVAHKYLNSKVEPTNADRILGTEAVVTEDINNIQATGAVRIGGIVWSARSEHDTPIPAGTLVRVLRIEGVKVYVEIANEKVEV